MQLEDRNESADQKSEPMIGTNLQNKWIITELISDVGGNGQVWKGKNLKGDYAAIKILRDIEDPGKSERRKARFENEIKKLKYIEELQIGGVMPIINHDHTLDGKPWYSMPIAQPVNIPTDFESRIRFLVELSEIVADLHKAGIEHRDIKPSNLLMLNEQLTVCDFGLARTEEDEHLTMTGERVGSVGYTAIECVGRSEQPRFECDVYSLGKISWVVLSGNETPPLGELKSPEDDLYSVWPDVPIDTVAQFQTLVFAAAQRSPQARPTAKQFRDGLNLLISKDEKEVNHSKAKPADRAKSLFGGHAETNKRITEIQSIIGRIQQSASRDWHNAWGETVDAIGWGTSRSNGGGTIVYRNLDSYWNRGQRHFSRGSISGIDFEISLTFKFKEPDGQNRLELGFAIAIEIPSRNESVLIVEKEYESYALGPQLTKLEEQIQIEVTSDKYQFVTIEQLNVLVKRA